MSLFCQHVLIMPRIVRDEVVATSFTLLFSLPLHLASTDSAEKKRADGGRVLQPHHPLRPGMTVKDTRSS